jgi:hypothetical protein
VEALTEALRLRWQVGHSLTQLISPFLTEEDVDMLFDNIVAEARHKIGTIVPIGAASPTLRIC